MKTQELGLTSLAVTRIAYGCMEIGGEWTDSPLTDDIRSKGLRVVEAALDEGINFFDHADIYCRGKSEEVFSQIWQARPGLRDKIFVQSKCGIRFENDPAPGDPQRFDFSAEHIMRSVEGSLKRLQTDYLDVLLLHRPDALVEPEEVAAAFDKLHEQGKVRFFGLSNHNAAQTALLQRYLDQPIVTNQMEFSLLHYAMVEEGIITNQGEPAQPMRGDGTIEYCRLHDITIQAWSPLARGAATGASKDARHAELTSLVRSMAEEKGVSGEAIALAWILRHPAHIQPVIGTTNLGRIQAACEADDVQLSREEWYALYTAARRERMP